MSEGSCWDSQQPLWTNFIDSWYTLGKAAPEIFATSILQSYSSRPTKTHANHYHLHPKWFSANLEERTPCRSSPWKVLTSLCRLCRVCRVGRRTKIHLKPIPALRISTPWKSPPNRMSKPTLSEDISNNKNWTKTIHIENENDQNYKTFKVYEKNFKINFEYRHSYRHIPTPSKGCQMVSKECQFIIP